MNEFWSQKARGLTPYVPGEQPRADNLIKLNTNENAYPPSPKVAEAVAEAISGLRLYPPPDSRVLREALAAYFGVPLEGVFVGNGSDEVLALAFLAYFDAGKPVAWPAVTYSFYPVYAGLFGMDPRPAAMGEGLAVDTGALIAMDCPVVLANPNAPTGRALSLDEVRQIADALKKRGHVLLVDEAYVAFGAESAVSLIDDHPNIVIVGTFSKSFALAGLRVGYALGQSDTIAALNAVKDSFNSYPLDRLAIAGAAAAVKDTAYYADTRARIIATRQRFSRGLQALGFEVLPSGANFVFARHPSRAGADIMAHLREHNILVRRFSAPEIEQYLRVTIGTDTHMDRVLEVLKAYLTP